MRPLAIGDIHGHTDALNSLLHEVSFSSSDKLVFLEETGSGDEKEIRNGNWGAVCNN